MSKTAKLREYLMVHGPSTAKDMSHATGIPATSVAALLKHDIWAGRISTKPLPIKRPGDNQVMYSIVDQRALAIERAKQLLIASGYQVTMRGTS